MLFVRIMFALGFMAFASIPVASAAVVTAEQYVAAARAELQRALQPLGGRFEFSVLGRNSSLEVSSVDAVQILASPIQPHVAPEIVVWVDLQHANQTLRRVPVRFRVQWIRTALVARTRLAARTAMQPHMFVWCEVDTARYSGAAITEFATLANRRLRFDLPAGAPLHVAAIEPRPPVETGERIRVIATVGGVTVERAAIAQRDGFPGQRIATRVIDGTATLRVEVLGEDLARVYGEG